MNGNYQQQSFHEAAKEVVVEPSSVTPNHNNNNNDDTISAFSNDSKLSIWTQTKLILLGINPSAQAIPEENEENDNNNNFDTVLGLSVPGAIAYDENGHPILTDTITSLNQEHYSNNNMNSKSVRWQSPVTKGSGGIDNNMDDNDCIDFSKDKFSEMTWGRCIALFLMKKYSWYNPALKKAKLVLQQQQQEQQPLQNGHERNGDNLNITGTIPTPTTMEVDIVVGSTTPNGEVFNSGNDPTIASAALGLNDSYPFIRSSRIPPSLESAWAYFEHVGLSRYIVPEEDIHNDTTTNKSNVFFRMVRKFFCNHRAQYQKAEPGEAQYPTRLYQPLLTPHNQLGDFGLGIGLYFSTLRALMILTLLAGLLNISNFIYFNSTAYNSMNEPLLSNNNTNLTAIAEAALGVFVMGSAICTDTSWVVCDDCQLGIDSNHFKNRMVNGTRMNDDNNNNNNDDSSTNMTFFLRNNCDGATIEQGMISYATLLFIMIGTIALNVYLKRMEVVFDEDEQTAQDYSVVIENPPPDATDPQEWHDFFKLNFDGAHVTALTIAVDNDLLVRTLVRRREILHKIQLSVEPGTSLDTLTIARLAAKEERQRRVLAQVKAMFVPGLPEFFSQLTVMNAKVQGLAQQDYPATKVFISFETEQSQRDVLTAYNLGSIDISRNNASKLQHPEKHLFRNRFVLHVLEPDEPNTVRWQDLNEKFKERIKQQMLTALCTFVAIFVIALLVKYIDNRELSTSATAYTIAAFNALFPTFAKFLTTFEAHKSEGDIQRSLYFKIALFRWVNTAVVITIVTPFSDTLSNKALINQIYALFFAEITTTNILQVLDPMGHIERHILAPRAITQDAMNLLMRGQVVELAERYTNMTKLLFLALWYCAIYPGALLLCSFSLFVTYFVDRFSFMRTWKRVPQLGAKISEFSRRYFFSLAIVAMALVSSYYWASFPFDNLCETTTTVNSNYTGRWQIDLDAEPIIVNEDTTMFQYCLQDFFRYPRNTTAFPFVSRNQIKWKEWMTEEQETVSNIYGYSAVGVMLLVLLSFLWKWYLGFMEFFRGSYESCGDDMGVNFSDVPSMNSYIPQVNSPVFSYPLLACNVDKIDSGLLEWTDPDKPHSYYDLTKDAEVLLRGRDFGTKMVFSQVVHWPPPQKQQQQQQPPQPLKTKTLSAKGTRCEL